MGKLYYRQGKEELLFDPNAYGQSKSKTITFNFLPSKDGKKVAIALTEAGKVDINWVRILNVAPWQDWQVQGLEAG